jgi:hypothetical protein
MVAFESTKEDSAGKPVVRSGVTPIGAETQERPFCLSGVSSLCEGGRLGARMKPSKPRAGNEVACQRVKSFRVKMAGKEGGFERAFDSILGLETLKREPQERSLEHESGVGSGETYGRQEGKQKPWRWPRRGGLLVAGRD